MQSQNPNYEEKVRGIFSKAAFIRELGITLVKVEPGRCETALTIEPRHMQQDNVVHAGVIATMADHTAGAASGSLIKDGEIVLTIEFKINFLRPTIGETLRCQAQVLRQGRQLIVAESEVFAARDGKEALVSKAMMTLAVVPALAPEAE